MAKTRELTEEQKKAIPGETTVIVPEINEEYEYVFDDDLSDFGPPSKVEIENTTPVIPATPDVIDTAAAVEKLLPASDRATHVEPFTDNEVTDPIDAVTDVTIDTTGTPEDTETQLNALRTLVNNLTGELAALRQGAAPVQEAPVVVKPEVKQEPVQTKQVVTPHFSVDEIVGQHMLDAEGFEDVLTNPEKFVAYLGKMIGSVMSTYDSQAVPKTVEQVYRSLPAMVTHQIEVQSTMQKTIDGFYTKHPVLKGHQNIVANNVHVIKGENPEMSMEACLEEAAKRSYQNLQLVQTTIDAQTRKPVVTTTVTKPVVTPPARAALPRSGPVRTSAGNRASVDPGLRSELDEL